jgi:conjugative transposon TraN protein
MCKDFVLLLSGLLFLVLQGTAQQTPKVIKPFCLTISNKQTTNLIFPFAIKSVDRGSEVILAQKALGVNNVLQLKADSANFEPTNLTVITSDARFYSFLLQYSDAPILLNLQFDHRGEEKNTIPSLGDGAVNEAHYNTILASVLTEKAFIRKRSRQSQIKLSLGHINIADGVLVFGLQLKNNSAFLFKPSKIRFYVKTGGKRKRTIEQEREIFPLYPVQVPGSITAHPQKVAIGFKPFTFYNTQQLIIQVEEADGRMIRLPVNLKTLLRARAIHL